MAGDKRKFHERFDLDVDIDDEKSRFATRVFTSLMSDPRPGSNLSKGELENLHEAMRVLGVIFNTKQEFLDYIQGDFIECLKLLQGMYDRLDVHFDKSLGESFYQPMLTDVVVDLVSKEIAQKSEGAICVFLEENAAPFIVRKSDGAFTYATTDLATIKYRIEQFKADSILYVVDARQSEHFRLLFGAAKVWGFDETEFPFFLTL